jgi:hypothetical protein
LIELNENMGEMNGNRCPAFCKTYASMRIISINKKGKKSRQKGWETGVIENIILEEVFIKCCVSKTNIYRSVRANEI